MPAKAKAPEPVEHFAKIIAAWADLLPIKTVYIFGSRARGDATPQSDLDVAVELGGDTTAEKIANWMHQNQTDFAELKKTLGVPLSLHADNFDAAWPAIKQAARNPAFVLGKVFVVATPPRRSHSADTPC